MVEQTSPESTEKQPREKWVPVALKRLNSAAEAQQELKNLMRVQRVQKQLPQRHVIELLDCFLHPADDEHAATLVTK